MAIDDDGKVLLVRQTYGPGDWRLPGGGVGRRETCREAALREAHEEVGLELRPDGTAELFGMFVQQVGNWHDEIALFIVNGWTIKPRRNWEIRDMGLFSPDALPSELSEATRRRLSEYQGAAPITERW